MRCGVRLAGVAALCVVASCATVNEGTVAFGIIGDMPYTHAQEAEYRHVLGALNKADLAFVAHVGDFQFDSRPYNQDPSRASMPCVDESYRSVLDSFQSLRHPVVVTPGDNDWTDCWPLKARQVDPLELLAKVRSMFFPEGRSLGQRPMAVRNQSADPKFAKFRENLRWSMAGVTFVTLHIVGSNDNFGRTAQMDAEHLERKAANLAWMRQAFAEARAAGSRGLVILTQANPGFENFWPPAAKTRYFIPFIARGKPLPSPNTAYRDYVAALAEELEGYDRPVIYIHGDTHIFRVDKPLFSLKSGRQFENFLRAETFGWPDSHWLRIRIDPSDPQLFVVEPQVVPENRVSRRAK